MRRLNRLRRCVIRSYNNARPVSCGGRSSNHLSAAGQRFPIDLAEGTGVSARRAPLTVSYTCCVDSSRPTTRQAVDSSVGTERYLSTRAGTSFWRDQGFEGCPSRQRASSSKTGVRIRWHADGALPATMASSSRWSVRRAVRLPRRRGTRSAVAVSGQPLQLHAVSRGKS